MVVRKPTPAGAFIPVSTLSRPHPDPASLSPHPHQIVTRESSSIAEDTPSSPAYFVPAPNDLVEVPQPCNVISETRCPSVGEQNATEKAFPVITHEGKTTQSLEEVQTGNSDIQRPGLSSSEKATPRSSLDSGRSRDFWEEDLPGSKYVNNDTIQSQQPPRLDIPATSTSEPTVAPTPPVMQASDPPTFAKRSNNPFRRENAYMGPSKSPGYRPDDFKFDQDAHDAHPPGKTFMQPLPINSS
jgi:hypothetical protein